VCTETAREVDEHLFIRPGTDALFVLAIANTLFTEGRVALGALAPHVAGLDELPGLIEPFTPEAVDPITGIAEDDIRRWPASCPMRRAAASTTAWARISRSSAR
jgi:anaerobic selenocysteine-containing dehydrogenase